MCERGGGEVTGWCVDSVGAHTKLVFQWRVSAYLVVELPLPKFIRLVPTTAPVIASTRMHAFAFRDHPDGTAGLTSMPDTRPVDSRSASSEGSTAPYVAILTLCVSSFRARARGCLSREHGPVAELLRGPDRPPRVKKT